MGCSTFSWLKFWGDDEEVELPAVLEDVTQKVSLVKLWDKKVGKAKSSGRIVCFRNHTWKRGVDS